MMRFSSIRWKRACLHRELPNHLHLTPSIFTSTNRDTWFNYQHFIHRTQKTLSMGSDVKSWSRAKLCEVKKLSLRLRQLGLTCTPHYYVMYCMYTVYILMIWNLPNFGRWSFEKDLTKDEDCTVTQNLTKSLLLLHSASLSPRVTSSTPGQALCQVL